MSTSPLSGFDDPAELKTCLRDLVGLLGLPALWSSREPEATVRVLTETLTEMLSLEACAVTASFLADRPAVCCLHVNGQSVDLARSTDWLPFLDGSGQSRHELKLQQEQTPQGLLTVARFSLGYYGCEGQIIVASSRPGFPRPTERILLRSAASLAASGLRTARMAQEREHALRAKDEFLAMLGHELRNPLAPIVTALDLLRVRERERLAPEYVIIERQVQHLRRLVDDLLDVTRITSGKVEVQQQVLEIAAAVQGAREAALPLIQQRRHRLRCEIPETGLRVRGDPLRLSQVFANLLINAAKYTEPGGEIAVTARRGEGEVLVEVRDNGIGIDAELLPRVFELFEQGRMPVDRSRGGLGIGLSVVKSLVTLHGGSVQAESDGPGQGSCFTVRLPQADGQAPAVQAAEPGADAALHCAERILLVDDNRDAAEVLGRLLEAYGYEVHIAYSPTAALSFCERLLPSIVIVDIGLPEIDGYELARRVRARFAGNPPRILAVTGYGQAQDRERSLAAGIEVHLTKPVPIERLLARIQRGAPAPLASGVPPAAVG